MVNLAVALALITYSFSYYVHLPGVFMFGVNVPPFVILVCSFVGWLFILRKLFANRKYQNRSLAYILLLANTIWVLLIVVHTYNSVMISNYYSSFEQIMAFHPIKTLEIYLSACYVFSKPVVLIAGLIYVYKLYKSPPLHHST